MPDFSSLGASGQPRGHHHHVILSERLSRESKDLGGGMCSTSPPDPSTRRFASLTASVGMTERGRSVQRRFERAGYRGPAAMQPPHFDPEQPENAAIPQGHPERSEGP